MAKARLTFCEDADFLGVEFLGAPCGCQKLPIKPTCLMVGSKHGNLVLVQAVPLLIFWEGEVQVQGIQKLQAGSE